MNFADLLALARNYNQALPAAGAALGATLAFAADMGRQSRRTRPTA